MDYKKLKKKYLKLQGIYHDLRETKSKYHKVLPKAIQMRKVLKSFSMKNEMNYTDLRNLHLDLHDPILDRKDF